MTSPDDLTPPTPDPLSPEHKLAMREDLLASTGRQQRAGRSWLMPGLAAAAVVAIVAVGAVAVQHHGDGPTGSSDPIAPAGGGTSVAPDHSKARPANVVPRTVPPSGKHVILRGSQVLPTQGGLPVSDPVTTCDDEIAALGVPGLQGATVTADRSYGDFSTSLYETKTDWIVCDDAASADGGAPTLFSPHQKADPYQPDLKTLAISENFSLDDRSWAQFVAAGRDFDGVQSISYAFPDGHVQKAVVGVNGLWSMTYLPTSGPLTRGSVGLGPIDVTVDYTDGHSDTFVLQWGLNTCAQVNHGC